MTEKNTDQKQPREKNLNTAMMTIEILRLIPPAPKSTHASQIKEQLSKKNSKFDRDLRTIQRQLDAICNYFPDQINRIDTDKPYRYSWKENARGLALQSITPRESVFLVLAREQLKYLLPPSLNRAMDSFINFANSKIYRNVDMIGSQIPDADTRLGSEWLSKIEVISESPRLIPPTVSSKIFETVSEALYNNQWLSITYVNAKGENHNRDIMPLGLVQKAQRLYLICRYRNREDMRTLVVHRIKKATPIPETFKRPPFNLKKYCEEELFVLTKGEIDLTFDIERSLAIHVLETPLSKNQTITDDGGDYITVSARVVNDLRLCRWLLGFGDKIRNVNPPEAIRTDFWNTPKKEEKKE